jgi:uncharacterized protein (UPF0332 family)
VKAELWLTKADRCLKTAELALADADPDSACNRAYYAMFNAARAALIIAGQSKLAMAKTHSGLVAAFGLHIAKAEHVPVELGRLLAIESNRRLASDYEGSALSSEDAIASIASATEFVGAVSKWAAQRAGDGGDKSHSHR